MKRLLALVVVTVALLMGYGTQKIIRRELSLTSIKTHSFAGTVLSKRELRQVVVLAERCGIYPVIEIWRTYGGLSVKGTEQIAGREVTFVTALMKGEKWSNKEMLDHRSSKATRQGDFWVEPDSIITTKLTTFTLTNRTVRVNLYGPISMPTADRIMEAFASRNIRFADEIMAAQLKGLDFFTPHELGIHGPELTLPGRYSAFFDAGNQCTWSVYFDFEGKEVFVVKVSKPCS